jgi:hypothetical protein
MSRDVVPETGCQNAQEFRGKFRQILANSGIAGDGAGAGMALRVPESNTELPEFRHLQEWQFRLPAFPHSCILAIYDMFIWVSK